jgi:hypothetical protein
MKDDILFSHNNTQIHHPLHQLHHLHHHLHRPYDRTASWTTVNGHSALSKYKYISFMKVPGACNCSNIWEYLPTLFIAVYRPLFSLHIKQNFCNAHNVFKN